MIEETYSMGDEVTLGDLPGGAVFVTRNDVVAVKSEYFLTNGQCLCILLASGEYAHFPDKNDTLVREVDLKGCIETNRTIG